MFSLRSFLSRRKMGKKGLVGSRKRKTSEQTLSNAAEHSRILAVTMLIAIWCVCVSILTFKKTEEKIFHLVMNQQAPSTEFSELPVFSYEDTIATREKQREEMDKVPLFFKVSSLHISRSLKRAGELFEFLEKHHKQSPDKPPVALEAQNPISDIIAKIPPAGISTLFQLVETPEQKQNFIDLLSRTLENGVMSREDKENLKLGQKIRIIDVKNRVRSPRLLVEMETPAKAADNIANEILKYYSGGNREVFHQALVKVSEALIGAGGNIVYDKEYTEAERNKAADAVPPVIVRYKKDQPLVLKGKIITERDLDILRQYSIQLKESTQDAQTWERILKVAIICMLLMVVTGIYISHIHPEVAISNQKIWVTGTMVIFGVAINYGVLELFEFLSPVLDLKPNFAVDIIPLALVPVVLSVTIGLRVAVYAGFFTSMIAGMMYGGSFSLVLNGMLISCLSGFVVRFSQNYKSFFFRVAGVVFVLTLLLNNQLHTRMELSFWLPAYAFINAFGTAIMALIMLFLLEFMFNVSTNMTLLALCDYNHPLLKRLQLEAPGTFHHSLMVATLAEQAATAIGASPIRARVGALFHDIGKLIKPEYFAENCVATDKHRELHPRMSSLIILNHVKEGVDMAIKYKLKKIIRDTIEQHHGTDMIFYFYKRAQEENTGDTPIAEGEYRYPGPLPKEKEVALVCLADACEAASRSIQKPTPAKIEALVWELLRKRIRDGQLDQANLTFRELAIIRDSFSKTLSTMMHGRIAYPKDDNNDEDEDDLFMASKKVSAAEEKNTEETD